MFVRMVSKVLDKYVDVPCSSREEGVRIANEHADQSAHWWVIDGGMAIAHNPKFD